LGALPDQNGQLLERSHLGIDHSVVVVRCLKQDPARPTLAAAADQGVHLQQASGNAGRALTDLEVSNDAVETDGVFVEQQVTVEPRRGLRNSKGHKQLGHALNEAVARQPRFLILYIRHIPNISYNG